MNLSFDGNRLSFRFATPDAMCAVEAQVRGSELLGHWTEDSARGEFHGLHEPCSGALEGCQPDWKL